MYIYIIYVYICIKYIFVEFLWNFSEVRLSVASSTDESFKDETRLLLPLSWFASDTAHFCVHPYNTCGEASAPFYGE